MRKTVLLGLLGHLMAAGMPDGRMTAGQRKKSDEERMRTCPMTGTGNLHPISAGKKKKKPFGEPKLSKKQRILQKAK